MIAALGAEGMKLPGTPGLADDELLTLIRNREAAARLTWNRSCITLRCGGGCIASPSRPWCSGAKAIASCALTTVVPSSRRSRGLSSSSFQQPAIIPTWSSLKRSSPVSRRF